MSQEDGQGRRQGDGKGSSSNYNVLLYAAIFGVATLFGKTVRQRVDELIHISHPKFRDELRHYAREVKYI